MNTYNDIYLSTRNLLRQRGIEGHDLEARLLVAAASGKTVTALLRDMSLYASRQIEEKVAEFTARRLRGEPVAYITGSWEFYGLPMLITPDVLIPRDDTEVLVETALELVRPRAIGARVLDLCTGSGCIGCAMAHELPNAKVVMIDNSRAALGIARKNVRLNSLSDRAVCIEADALKPPAENLGSFDIIISNPPYIASAEIATLDSSVKDHEPRAALDGGADGLDFYRFIIKEWKKALRSGGHMAFEVGETQAEDVKKLLLLAGFKDVDAVKDSAGIWRVVHGRI